MFRTFPLFLAALVAMPCAALSGSRLLGGDSQPPIPQFAAFAPWATIGWTAVLILVLLGRTWWLAIVIAVLLAVQVSWVLPTRAAQAAAGERPGAVPLRVMTVNIHVGSADLPTVLRLVAGHNIDLLVIEEGQPEYFRQVTSAVAGQLPYADLHPDPAWAGGTGIWSRWPIRSIGAVPISPNEGPQVLLQMPGAVPVTVTGVHTISPAREAERITAWKRDLAILTTSVDQVQGPHLVLGDFNATRDHRPFRELLATGLVDAAETVRLPAWQAVTWPADRHRVPALVRLDHVLVTPDSIGVAAVRVVEVLGTDHRAVLADLKVRPAS